MTDAPRWMAYESLDELVPALVNPKYHDDESIAASLRRFGYVEAITVDERTGRLVAGHGRVDELLAKQAAGEPPPEGVTVDPDGRWQVAVQHGWASANDEEALAYVLASNQTSIAGGWRTEELAEALASLDDLLGTAFISSDIDRLVAEARQRLNSATDAAAEWARAGMPEFDQPSLQSARSAHIHFANVEDSERFFAEVLGRPGFQRSIWWPEPDGHVGSDQTRAYVADLP